MNRQLENRNNESVGFLDPFFDAFFGNEEDKNFGVLAMKTDIKEDEKNYEMDVELPGFDKKDISLNMKDGYLTVSAKVDRNLNEKEKKGYIHRERFSGMSTRSYYVGDVDEKSIKAAYKDGVLAITFPKDSVKAVEDKHSIAIE
ncbi:MAG: Acid shock protein [Tenericutes bacterium ADurb.BinA155]|nr:MAG: Acid shock protein [Tenericutes bacterium ADurb.BinA155]